MEVELKLSEYFTGFLCKHFPKIVLSMKCHWNDAPNCSRQSNNDAIFSLACSISTKCTLLALHNWWQTLFYTRLCCIMISFIDPFRKSWFASLRVCLRVCECLSVFSPSSFFPSRCLNFNFFRLCSPQRVFIHLWVWCTSAHVETLVSFVVSVIVGCWCLNISIQTVADCQIYLLN